jgi:hypothetical protein
MVGKKACNKKTVQSAFENPEVQDSYRTIILPTDLYGMKYTVSYFEGRTYCKYLKIKCSGKYLEI